MNSGSNKSRYELTVELIKAVAWPLFAFVILISFWRPLHSTVNQLPDLVYRSDTITVAGLSLKIDRSLALQGEEPSREVRDALAQLLPKDLRRLLEGSDSTCYHPPVAESGPPEYKDLIEQGLFREMSAEALQDFPDCVYGVQMTELGYEARDFLFTLISEFIQQLNQPAISISPAAPTDEIEP